MYLFSPWTLVSSLPQQVAALMIAFPVWLCVGFCGTLALTVAVLGVAGVLAVPLLLALRALAASGRRLH
ncbi:MAG: hypothetical protein R3E83_15185 [Burkholderiaceae bacterium]